MRKLLVFALVATFAFGATALVATDADARAKGQGILGSAHDFTDDNDKAYNGGSQNINEWNGAGTDGVGENRAGGWNYRGEVCRVCHAPHDKGRSAWQAWDGADAGLLWNHGLSDTDNYAMYSSSSLRGSIADNVVGKSKLCLSCHDGTVAINAFDRRQTTDLGTHEAPIDGGDGLGVFIQAYDNGFLIGPSRRYDSANASTTVTVPGEEDENGDPITTTFSNGNDFLMGNHPISVAYLAGGPDGTWPANPKIVDSGEETITNSRSGVEMPMGGGLWDPTDRTFGVFEQMTFAPTIDLVLEKGMVQCHSCHDVHDSPGVNSIGTRLNRAGQGMPTTTDGGGADPSGLCLSCHAK